MDNKESYVQYKCPCCGAPLRFSGHTQKLSCGSCKNQYEISVLQQLEKSQEGASKEEMHWKYSGADTANETIAQKTEDGKYICPSCGGEVEADENTISTNCPYCGNVMVLRHAAQEEKPDVMIPFQIEGTQAKQMLEGFCAGKRLLPKNFRDKSYLKNLKGYYVPYWLFDCKVNADMSFRATRTRMWSDSEYDYIETSFYLVNRAGNMEFYHVPVDGSIGMEDETTESIEPFDYSGLTDFSTEYLAGYETEKYDVTAQDAKQRANERIFDSAEDAIRSTVRSYATVNVQSRSVTSDNGKISYALLPVWLFESVYGGRKYQFAINGQTGKMVGELPVDMGAFWKYLFGFTTVGTVVLSVIGILLFGGVL